MKRVVCVISIGVLLSLALSSGAFCAPGGGYSGGHGTGYSGGHGGSYGGGGHQYNSGGGRHYYGGSGVYFGGYFGFPYYYPYPYYRYYYPYSPPHSHYPDAVAEPPVYVEPRQPFYWYFCQDSQTFYPYVTSCPGGWMKVVPNQAYAHPDTPPPDRPHVAPPPPAPRQSPPPQPTPAAVLQPIYFDLNKSVIKPDAVKTLKENLEWFRHNPGRRVNIQGYCDPRATGKYNLALGERRAEATKKYLIGLGVDAALLETVSYGKDRSSCKEKDESCWAKERRVDFEPMPQTSLR